MKDEDVNLSDMDGVVLCAASLLVSSGAGKDVPRAGGAGVAGSKPEARNFAIRGFSTDGGARLIWLFCGTAVGGWIGVACTGGGVGWFCDAVALRSSARLLELRNDGVLEGGDGACDGGG